MKSINIENAVGLPLAHDLTKIVPGIFKGAAFKKGYTIKQEDITELKRMGKDSIYVLSSRSTKLHEDEAALFIAKAVSGEGVSISEPSEGKVYLMAMYKGLLKVNVKALEKLNMIDQIILSTSFNNAIADEGKPVAAAKVVPLSINKSKIHKVEEICLKIGKIVCLKPFHPLRTGIVVTGSEVYYGRIDDKFGDILKDKIKRYGGEYMDITYVPDDQRKIADAIMELINSKAEVILVAGGMSVDATDRTPYAIRKVADKVVSYGSPVLPGAMFMLAYKGDRAILGVPGGAIYHKTTVFDLIFPRILARDNLTRRDIASLGHGGLCRNCRICHYT